jgi:hypothetical protein
MELRQFWIIYQLSEDVNCNFISLDMQNDLKKWKMINSQVFERSNKLYVSVLWDANT